MLISCGGGNRQGRRCAPRHLGLSENGDPTGGGTSPLELGRQKVRRTNQPTTTQTTKHTTKHTTTQFLNNAAEWEYVAEGGANVVFRNSPGHRGEDSPEISGSEFVLRVPKSSQPFGSSDLLEFIRDSVLPVLNNDNNAPSNANHPSRGSEDDNDDNNNNNDNNDDDDDDNDNQTRDKYRMYGRLVVPASPSFLDDLNERMCSPAMEARRPEHRRGSPIHCPAMSTSLVATNDGSNPNTTTTNNNNNNNPLMLLPNVIAAGDVCIELKPKSSLGPGSNSNRNHPTAGGRHGQIHSHNHRHSGGTMKQRTCRYCMHQAYKVHSGKLQRHRHRDREYCPMDLFSGEASRMAKAVRALLDEPQNNLRLFRPDGNEFEFTGAILSATKTNRSSTVPGVGTMSAEELIAVVVHALRESGVLDDLRRAHELDALDIEGIWQVREAIESFRNEEDTATPLDVDAADRGDFHLPNHPLNHQSEPKPQSQPQLTPKIHRLLEAMGCEKTSTWKEIRSRYQKVLEEFLLATTMKDCSLLLSIRKSSIEENPDQNRGPWNEMEYRIECGGDVYFVLISIVDLDRKPASRLSKYFRMDHDIVHHYSENHGLHARDCFGPVAAIETETMSQSSFHEVMVPVRGNLMCRLLFPNPVCLLTVYDRKEHTSNVMTLTWLTPVDNSGTFVCSIHKRRHTASLLAVSSTFVLNVPTSDLEDTVLGIGSCSGRDTDKFQKFGLELCRPGGTAAGATAGSSAKKNKKKDKKHRDEQDGIKHAIALRDCIAHTVCIVKEKQDQGQHWLLVCEQQLAWCRKPYFEDGKRFRRSSESLAPYMTFLGSKTFGSVV